MRENNRFCASNTLLNLLLIFLVMSLYLPIKFNHFVVIRIDIITRSLPTVMHQATSLNKLEIPVIFLAEYLHINNFV